MRSAAPVAPAEAYVRIGSKIPNAVLYLDGKAEGFLGALKFVKVGSGAVRIGVHADGCRSWDSVVSLAPRDTLRINYRNPVCSP